jgi:uncharacterized lipoprotein YmbA
MRAAQAVRACSCAIVLLLNACGSVSQDAFYTLSPLGMPVQTSQANAEYSVSIARVTVPAIVDRPEFVLRQGANRVDVSESHRWSQPLQAEIADALAHKLGEQLPRAQVMVDRSAASQNADYQVTVNVEQFDAIPGKSVMVQALWSVKTKAGSVVKTAHTAVQEPVNAEGYDPIVAAYSRALERISTDIANAVSALQTNDAH